VVERSPASSGRIASTVSRTAVSGRSNGCPAQRATITSEEAPMPRVNRPPLSSASDTALIPSTTAVRVCAGTTATPSSRSVATASAPRVVNASGPCTSEVQQAA
jgi:hypothetical protein